MSNNSSLPPKCVPGTRGSRNRHISDRHIRRLFRHINNHRCPGKVTREGVSGSDPRLGTENIQRLTKRSNGWFPLNCHGVKRSKNYHRLSPFHPSRPLAAFIYTPRRGRSWRHDGRQADRHAGRQAGRRVPGACMDASRRGKGDAMTNGPASVAAGVVHDDERERRDLRATFVIYWHKLQIISCRISWRCGARQ